MGPYEPAAQPTQAPAAPYLPAGQAVHAVAPATDEEVLPAAHVVQTVAPVAAV